MESSPPNFSQNPFFEASPSQDSEVDEEAGGLKWVPSANMGKFHVKNLSPVQQQEFLQSLFKGGEDYNELFLKRIEDRMDRVGVKLPTVEVRFQNLTVEAKCYVGRRALPTLWNATRNTFEGLLNLLGLSPTEKVTLPILKDISGIIEPSRMTLLLGPPGSGKTTMLLALAGRLDPNLKVKGEITYNGYSLDEFVSQKTSSYISQDDLHLGELTVRETLEFSSRCQGVGAKQDILSDIARREKSRGISPDPDIDLFMKTTATEGTSLQTDYILKMLGLDVCADTIVGDEMIRGISGGQKKRVTTGAHIL